MIAKASLGSALLQVEVRLDGKGKRLVAEGILLEHMLTSRLIYWCMAKAMRIQGPSILCFDTKRHKMVRRADVTHDRFS